MRWKPIIYPKTCISILGIFTPKVCVEDES